MCVCACVCVCVCVCVSVKSKSHLASGAFAGPKNPITYSVGKVGRKIVRFSLKLLRSRAMALPALYGYIPLSRPFSLWEYAREPAVIRAIPTASAAQAREYMQRFR